MDSYPSTDERVARVETEDEMLRVAAGAIGLDLEQFSDRPIDFAIWFEAAERSGRVPADFNQDVAKRTLEIMRHNAALEQQYRVSKFDGDLLFFFAGNKEGDYRLPQVWQPFVTGNIEVHTIHCKHHEMTEPSHLKEIGRILENRLRSISV